MRKRLNRTFQRMMEGWLEKKKRNKKRIERKTGNEFKEGEKRQEIEYKTVKRCRSVPYNILCDYRKRLKKKNKKKQKKNQQKKEQKEIKKRMKKEIKKMNVWKEKKNEKAVVVACR